MPGFMGWYLRKRFGSGPLRLNLSKRGLGMSVGVPGARIGLDASGRAYVHCGRGGVYYRSRRGSAGERDRRGVVPTPPQTVGQERIIDSADVSNMVPSSAHALLAELARRQRVIPVFVPFGLLTAAAAVGAIAYGQVLIGAWIACVAVVGTAALVVLFNKRRTFTLDFALDSEYADRYSQVLLAFARVCAADRFWLIQSEARVLDRKYHAGAGQSIRRTPVCPALGLPLRMRSNVTPPRIPAGRQTLYLFPDRLLVFDRGKIGAVEYSELTIDAAFLSFVESERPPTDAQTIDSTWEYTNKDGGPDRRFVRNRQLPVMRYGELRIQSPSGLNECFQVSDAETAEMLAVALRRLAAGLDTPGPQRLRDRPTDRD